VPRSPLISQAVRDLALYFQAVTDGAFIDQSWALNEKLTGIREDVAGASSLNDTLQKLVNITRNVTYSSGVGPADQIAELINGSVGIGSFASKIDKDDLAKYVTNVDPDGAETPNGQLKFYAPDKPGPDIVLEPATFDAKLLNAPAAIENSLTQNPSKLDPNMYAVAVFNPFISPMMKDTGAIEIFMNAIPTLEFSKCVPYINLELVATRRTVGTTAPALTLHGFLNPPTLGSADKAIIGSYAEQVRSEVLDLGEGNRAGIELFTSPQTLVNMGETGFEFVPIIDRMRPLASLGNLQLTTKLQGGVLTFTTGRLEITIHDRSRLREMAAFVRPDLYGTTFLDITYGWSHPEGGASSRNKIGQFLDALKHQARYRISNSSYSFEEGGQIKVTLSIQTVGSIDMLYIGPRTLDVSPLTRVRELTRDLNNRLSELRGAGTTPSMAQYDVLDSLRDPSSALSANASTEKMKEISKLLDSKQVDQEIVTLLHKLYGATMGASANDGAAGSFASKVEKTYTGIIDSLKTFDSDSFATSFTKDEKRTKGLGTNLIVALSTTVSGSREEVNATTSKSGGVYAPEANAALTEFVSFGSVFMKMVAEPIKNTGQYDEVQVIFYPFNKYAGTVHDLPTSCFPIEKGRLKEAVAAAAREVPELSARALVRLLNDRFIAFAPARAYLMAGFYNQAKDVAGAGKAEANDVSSVNIKPAGGGKAQSFTPSAALTLEARLRDVGVPEAKLKLPRVEIAVEGTQLLDMAGIPILDPATGKPKTLIKIHVYDGSMEPNSTLSEIITAAKDNELSMIQVPVAEYVVSGGSNGAKEAAALQAVSAGLAAGILEAVDKKSLDVISTNGIDADTLNSQVKNGTVLLRIKGSYEDIKRVVSAGMPTITYGSSTSAVTNASLTTGGNAGLANVMLMRAFNSPGEKAEENVDSGVPMQVLPAQLSMSTIGCPLFSPMQRFFVDFGTGTSLDSCYFVVSVDSTIGKDGFKTELKMAYSAGFPTYSSLNQQLAALSVHAATATGAVPAAPAPAPTPATPSAPAPAAQTAAVRREVTNACADAQRIVYDLEIKAKKALEGAKAAADSAANEAAAQALEKLSAAIPVETQLAAVAAAEAAKKATADAAKIAADAERVTAAVAQLSSLPPLLKLLSEAEEAALAAKIDECLGEITPG